MSINEVVNISSHDSGSGLCPVCHKERSENDCRTSWSVEWDRGGIIREAGFTAHLSVYCYGFKEDQEEAYNAVKKYHNREDDD